MKVKKILSVFLVLVSLLSLCSFSSFAADLNPADFIVSQAFFGVNAPNGYYKNINIADKITTSSSGNEFSYSFPAYGQTTPECKYLVFELLIPADIRADREYHVKFNSKWRIDVPREVAAGLVISDSSGNQQDARLLYSGDGQNQYVDFSFVLKKADLPDSYRVSFFIYTLSRASYYDYWEKFTISNPIIIEDTDDNSGWFQRILNAIKDLPTTIVNAITSIPNAIKGFIDNLWQNIKNAFESVGQWFSELGDKIGQWFVDLGDNIKDFFTMLKNYLLYFQHPVTVNDDGVLVGADGQPVYTNPFDGPIDKVEETVNSWISKLNDFISSMEDSRVKVSGYLEQGSSVITKVLTAVPILSAVVAFAAGFFVIRKLVGR